MTPPGSQLARPAGERGAGKGGVPGPALSVRALPGHALPTVKDHIPEPLSEGGSSSRSRLMTTVRVGGFDAVALLWRAGKRALKTGRVLGCERYPPVARAARSMSGQRFVLFGKHAEAS